MFTMFALAKGCGWRNDLARPCGPAIPDMAEGKGSGLQKQAEHPDDNGLVDMRFSDEEPYWACGRRNRRAG